MKIFALLAFGGGAILSAATAQDARARYNQLPRSFEPNAGQADPAVRFISRGSDGQTVLLADREAVFLLRGSVVRMKLAGSTGARAIEGLDPQPGVSNYFAGNDATRWRTGVPHYGRARMAGVYRGVDLIFYGNQGRLEYDFAVAAGASPDTIRLTWEGVGSIHLQRSGDLLLGTRDGELRMHRPRAFQRIGGVEKTVGAQFRMAAANTVGFKLSGYDPRFAVVIDPVLTYSTFVGGTSGDSANGIAVDSTGSVYICGSTGGTAFPLSGPIQGIYGGGLTDAFVTKLNPAGSGVVYSTFLGGAGDDVAYGIAVDSDGNAYVGGETSSMNFPVFIPFQLKNAGDVDGFVTKLSPTGGALVYSTYLGGTLNDTVRSVALDAARSLYVTGQAFSNDFPTTAGVLKEAKTTTDSDAFITKLAPAGNTLVYSTYIGGSDQEMARVIALDGAGNAYLTGTTTSNNFPTTPGAFQPINASGTGKAFVAKVNPAGSGVAYGSYLGGSDFDSGGAIAVDEAGRAYVTGNSASADFPKVGAFRSSFAAGEAFVTKFNSMASTLIYSTYLGGSAFDNGLGIQVSRAGNAFVTGTTSSGNFPTAGTPFQPASGGGSDAFLTVFNPLGSPSPATPVYSTYLGGSGNESANMLAIDASNNAYLAGATTSPNFPATPASAFDVTYNGATDAFVTKFSEFTLPPCLAPVSSTDTSYPASGGNGAITVTAPAGCAWNGIASMPFLSVTGGASGSAAGTVTYGVGMNAAAGPRTGSVSVAGNIVQIMQSGTGLTAPFTDVPLSHPYVNFIQLMKTNAITSGCTPTEYCPDNTTTRGQMGVFIIRSMLGGDNFPFPATPFFTDVPAAHPYFKWIQKMRELGITSGCTATAYCPDDVVTRGQMAVFIIRGLAGNTFTNSAAPYFTDVPTTHPYFTFIQKMKEWGITTGCTATSYCPDNNTTRGQMGVFIIRAFFSPR